MAQTKRGIKIKPSKTTTVHVGNERWGQLSEIAIEVSYKGKVQITPSEFMRYMIDHFQTAAKEKYISEIKAGVVIQEK